MTHIYDEFEQRGFLYQCTDEEAVREMLDREKVTFYVGFDPTANSLHIGSLIPILGMMHLQMAGHKPIAVVGCGTTMVGDPSGKTEMRKMLMEQSIRENGVGLRKQLERFLTLDGEAGFWLDNADWLLQLNYVDFLREIGKHFSVNRMLSAESYKQRLETGLSFLEFNYMLLQAYDFLVLYKQHDCKIQFGGQDQWGNIVAGTDLIRRETGGQGYGMTFPLLTDAAGQKLGKTVAGAIWLDSEKTPPFDFYQYWRNVEDADVKRFLLMFTFLPVDECNTLGDLQPPLLNRGKEILGFEVTKLVHGEAVAAKAYQTALEHFPTADPDNNVPTTSTISTVKSAAPDLPTATVPAADAKAGISIPNLFRLCGLCKSGGEARRLIRQGGARLNDEVIKDETLVVSSDALESEPVLKAGKKRMVKIVVE
jgi:tyrosyl-tRNA synthetase